MSFRLRLTLATAAAVAVAVVVASIAAYLFVRSELLGQVDDALRARAGQLADRPLPVARDPNGRLVLFDRGPDGIGGGSVFLQAVRSDGAVARPPDQAPFPVTARTLAVARGAGDDYLSDATVAGTHVRVLTVPAGAGFALQLVRPLVDLDRALGRLRLALIAISICGIGVAALLGAIVARAALAPVRRLTREAELVAETQDLAHRIDVAGADELSRLGASFNTMLGALERSQQAQRQLVVDASHELRTPLTSLRTNVEVLARADGLPDTQREALLADLVGELEEMSLLVTNLVELASEPPRELETSEVQLDQLADDVIARARRLSPQLTFRAELEPCVVVGVASRIERALANVLDNAVKWSPPSGAIEVSVAAGAISVRDHGPGIDAADLPFVFDRFFRSASARALPGSGLGLSLVRQVVDEHGGSVEIGPAAGGGTLVRLSFPLAGAERAEAAAVPAGGA